MPKDKAGAMDTTDAEIIKGPGAAQEPAQEPAQEHPTAAAQSNLTTSAALEASGGPATTATQGSLGSSSASSSPVGSATTSSSAKPPASAPALTVHSIISTQVGEITQDADVAMSNLRGDVGNLHKLLSNAAHYATLPVAEVEKLIARASALLGVIRSKI